MNNKMELQKAASKRRRKMKTRKYIKISKGSKHSRSVADLIAKFLGGGHGNVEKGFGNVGQHAMGGGRSNIGANPIYAPKRTKFKGYMRAA